MALVVTSTLRPFVDAKLDQLQTLSLVITCLTIFYGLLIQISDSDLITDTKERSVYLG